MQVIQTAYDRILRPCYEEWRDLSKGRRKARRFLRRLMNRELARAFGHWADLAEAIFRLRSIAMRWDLRALAKAFDTWYAVRQATSEEMRTTQVMERFVRRLHNRQLSGGWEAWKAWWKSRAANRDTARSVAARLANPGLSRAFDTWKATAQGLAAKKAKMLKVLRRHFSEGLSRGWNSWIAYVEPFLVLRRAARALSNVPVRKAFNSWAGTLGDRDERQRKEELARNALGRLANRELSRAFEAWSFHVEERHRAWGLLDRVSRRWLLLEAAGCLHYWAEVVAERRRLERMLRGFAMRLSNPGLAKAWGSWLEHCERQKRMAGLMEYWRNGKSAYALQHKVFTAWRRSVHDGFLTRQARRLWGLEQFLADVLWTIEGGVEKVVKAPLRALRRRRRRGSDDGGSDEGSDDDSFDDDIPNRERRRLRAARGVVRRRVAPEDDLPAMDGPYAHRRRTQAERTLAAARRMAVESEMAEAAAYLTVERFPNVLREYTRPAFEARGFATGRGAATARPPRQGRSSADQQQQDDGAGVGVGLVTRRHRPPPPPDATWSGDPSFASPSAR